ncbi:MAG TPA: sulfotransferase [Acidimicrobiales bacterium]|nr:sulfotransferase [Acidimicrobiales bacterium]
MSAREGPRPNLFLIGVQRSATTAMWTYLSKHPEIFMAPKELHYFGADLGHCAPGTDGGPRISLEQYLKKFEGSGDRPYRGDASVGYIYSATAAREILEFAPDARIVASFRNPIDMTYSVYGLLSFQGMEPARDYATAFADDALRWAYTNGQFKWCFTYRRLVAYTEQLERYLETFGPERVHVVVYEDLAEDTGGVYGELLRFLGVDDEFRPELPVVWANRQVRSDVLQRFLWESPAALRRVVRAVLPNPATRRRLGARLAERNKEVAPRQEISPALRRRLEEELSGEVERFSSLVGRDLRARWFGDAVQP